METNCTIKLTEFASPEYLDSVELRREVLRKPLGLDFSENDLAEDRLQFHFVAVKGSEIIGILILKPFDKEGRNFVKMRQVAVQFEYQNSGIGGKLLEFSENWARTNNYAGIELNARTPAVNFYLKHGYRVIGEEFLEVGIPHLHMIKQLR